MKSIFLKPLAILILGLSSANVNASVISPPEGNALHRLETLINLYLSEHDALPNSWQDLFQYDPGLTMLNGYLKGPENIGSLYSFIPAKDRSNFPNGQLLLIRYKPMDWPELWDASSVEMDVTRLTDAQRKEWEKVKSSGRPIRYLVYRNHSGKLITEWWYENQIQAMITSTGLTIPPPTPYSPQPTTPLDKKSVDTLKPAPLVATSTSLPAVLGLSSSNVNASVISPPKAMRWWWLRGGKMKISPQVTPASEKPSGSAVASPSEQLPNEQQLKWQEKMRQLDQTPMELFGIVIDEKNQPVPGAKVRISWNPLQGDTEVVLMKTGLDGKFTFTGRKGRYINVDLSKEGYAVVLGGRSQLPFNFAAPPGKQGYRSNPDQPEIFRLRKKGGNPALVHKSLRFVFPPDGTLKIHLQGTMTDGDEQLEFTLIKSNKRHPFAWTAKAKIQHGGFIKAEGQFPFEAPEEGYQEELTWSFPLNEQGRQRHIDFEETYFIAFGSPRKYGRITLWPKADTEKLLVEYYFDPTGGRNLEPVPPPSHAMPAPNPLDP